MENPPNLDTRKNSFANPKDPTTRRHSRSKIVFDVSSQEQERLPVLAAWSHAGGVGKTTSQRIIGECIANYILPFYLDGKKKVLFIDLDTQCNTSNRYLHMRRHQLDEVEDHDFDEPPLNHYPQYLNGQAVSDTPLPIEEAEEARSSLCDLYDGLLPIPYRTSHPHIDILPASGSLLSRLARTEDLTERARMTEMVRAEFLDLPAVKEIYALVLFDTPPAANFVSSIATSNCTHCYIPLVPEKKAVDGLDSAYKKLKRQRNSRPISFPLEFMCILPVMYQERIEHKRQLDYVSKHESFGPHLLTHKALSSKTSQRSGAVEPLGFPRLISFAEQDTDPSMQYLSGNQIDKRGFTQVFQVVNLIARELGLVNKKTKKRA